MIYLILILGVSLLLSLLVLSVLLSPSFLSSIPRGSTASERTYTSATSFKPLPLPSITDDAKDGEELVDLSVVVPAYNEQERLPIMLTEAVDYLESLSPPITYEVLIVDDGSTDNTISTGLEFAKERLDTGGRHIRVIKLAKNRGKGGAVKHGVLHSRGKRILFVDADGASFFPDLALLQRDMDVLLEENKSKSTPASNGHAAKPLVEDTRAIVLGSRAHMVTSPAVVKRSALRNLLMRSFHIYLSVLGISNIKDTQCGFKLFTRPAARAIFPSLHVEGWIFDIEILIIAELLGDVKVKETPITWKEVNGSKMNLIKDSLRMATDLVVIRASYALGRWKVRGK